MKLNPCHEFLPKTSGRNTRESDTSRLTSGLELFGGERFSTFRVDHLLVRFHNSWEHGLAHHIINPDSLELASDLVFENIVGTESVHTDIFTHGNKLRSTQVIQRDIIMEQLGDSNDIGIRRGLSSGSYLYVSSETCTGGIRELTFRKNRLNSSLLMTLSILSPDPRTVS
jgi:hypothetical protein